MSSRREFLKQSAAAGLAASMSVQAAPVFADIVGSADRVSVARHPSSRIKAIVRREETVLRYGGNGDNWHMSWGADDRQYVSLCDGTGFSDQPKVSYNSRLLAISGGPRGASFHDLPGYPMLGAPPRRPKDPRYYSFGTLALDACIYQFMSTFNRPFDVTDLEVHDPNNLVRFIGAKLIYSPDNGRNWYNQDGSTPIEWESWGDRSRRSMVFFEENQEAFSLLTVLQMGRNYEHNRDGYIYVYAPNGNKEGTMNELVMFRVPKRKLLDRASYEFFAGWGGGARAQWTPNIDARAIVHTFPSGWVNTSLHPYAWHPSVVYNRPLDVYMMANWGMGTARDGMWFDKPSYLGFWVARNPWGPWVQVHEETAWLPGGDKNARAYQAQIAPKWIAADGKSFWLVWTDFHGIESAEIRKLQQEYKYQDTNRIDEYADYVIRSAAMMRKYMPHYGFNVQRVDVIV